MEILPSIDLRGGKVVRLERGDYDRQTTYAADPAAVAREFAAAGAKWIHVVDLDAALEGRAVNTDAVRAIRAAVNVRIELGGGMRSEDAIRRALDGGADRVVVGSAAMKDWAWFESLAAAGELGPRLALGLDAREGRLAAQGWTEQLDTPAVEVAARTRGWPLGAIVHTDIARDGMLEGVNVEATAEVVAATDVPVIASGGVSALADIEECIRIGCAGAIVGRAYYEGRVDLRAACELAGREGR